MLASQKLRLRFFSLNGNNAAKTTTVTFFAPGSYEFDVAIRDSEGNTVHSTVDVTVDSTLSRIVVTPDVAKIVVATSATQSFAINGYDQFGDSFTSTLPTASWSADSGTISSGGLYTASGSASLATITASVTVGQNTLTATASAVIEDNGPAVATNASASPSTVTATTTSLSVLGSDDNGESTLTYNWVATKVPQGTPTPAFSVNDSHAASDTTVTFYGVGNYVFTVTMTDEQGRSTVSRVAAQVQPTISSISVTPASDDAYVGGPDQMSATATDQFGSPLVTQPSFEWTTTNGTIDGNGLLTASTTPTTSATVSATIASNTTIVGSTTVEISLADTPTVVTAASSSQSTVTGTTVQLSVLGGDLTGETNLTYTWAATTAPVDGSDPAFSVNGTNDAKNTTVTFDEAGSYQFTVTIENAGGISTTSSVGVTVAQTATGLTISPPLPVVPAGDEEQLTATLVDQFGNEIEDSGQQPSDFSWQADDETITGGVYRAPSSAPSDVVTATIDVTGVGTFSGSVTVNAVSPEPTISGGSTTVIGLPYTLDLATDGSGFNTIQSWTVDWGDGIVQIRA